MDKARPWLSISKLDAAPQSALGWLALALLLHVPLLPLAFHRELSRLLERAPVSRLPPVSDIPIDLLEDSPRPKERVHQRQPRREAKSTRAARPEKPTKQAPPSSPQHRPPPSPEPAPPRTAQQRAAGSSGDEHNPLDADANVRLLLHGDALREHGLGEPLTSLTRGASRWDELVGVEVPDPGRHIERMLLLGSELRETRDLVAIVELSVPAGQVKADAGRFVTLPTAQTVIAAPQSARRAAEAFSPDSRLAGAAHGELASLFLAKPWHTLAPLSLHLPRTLRAARLRLFAGANGGARLQFTVKGESEALASADAETLARELDAAATLPGGERLFDALSVKARGRELRGQATMSRAQLELLLTLAGRALSTP